MPPSSNFTAERRRRPTHHRVKQSPFGYLTFQGKGPRRQDQFTVLCGDNPPTIVDGYAQWTTIPRPLLRGVTVFQGYNPAGLQVEVRFGVWDDRGWRTDDVAGRSVESDIEKLEWMAGANFTGGPSPYVYANSYGPRGGTTPLIPSEYQQTAGVSGSQRDTKLWPWVINGGITWNHADRNHSGYRIRQDASFTLTNYQGFSPPAQKSAAGGYFVARPGRDTPLLIAAAPSSHALFPEALAGRIKDDPKNAGLKLRSIRGPIKHGRRVWIPSHQS